MSSTGQVYPEPRVSFDSLHPIGLDIPKLGKTTKQTTWHCSNTLGTIGGCDAQQQGANYKGQLNNLLHLLLRRRSDQQRIFGRWLCWFSPACVFLLSDSKTWEHKFMQPMIKRAVYVRNDETKHSKVQSLIAGGIPVSKCYSNTKDGWPR